MGRMTHDDLEGRQRRAAVVAAAWTVLLFGMIPLVRTIQRWIGDRDLDRWITPMVVVVLLALVMAAALYLLRRGDRLGWADGAWLGMVAAVAVGWAWHLRGRPEEAIHLVEYGILCWLIYRAIRPPVPDAAVLVSAVLLGTIMGTVDEIIQWITPARFWDLRDVALNGGACVLGAIVTWRLDPGPWRRPHLGSMRFAVRTSIALVVLIVLCLANTPPRVAWYAARVPGLGLLAHASNEMAEYGHLHQLPGIGEFKSRLTLEELADQDRRRGHEAAAIIDRYPDSAYREFHREVRGFADPLVYESRVHIFSRDSNAWRAQESPPGSNERRQRSTVAYREHLLLEAVFPTTLARSVHRWDRETALERRKFHDPDSTFRSRAGSHLITWISEPALRAALLLVALVLVAVDVALGSRRPKIWESET